MVQSAKQSGSNKILERLHAAKEWMTRSCTGTVHVLVELPVTLTARNTSSQTRIMCRTRWSKINAMKTLANQAISTKRVSWTTWAPWRTTPWSTCHCLCCQCCTGHKHNEECKRKRLHGMALLVAIVRTAARRYVEFRLRVVFVET